MHLTITLSYQVKCLDNALIKLLYYLICCFNLALLGGKMYDCQA